jgi:hypothetical protein
MIRCLPLGRNQRLLAFPGHEGSIENDHPAHRRIAAPRLRFLKLHQRVQVTVIDENNGSPTRKRVTQTSISHTALAAGFYGNRGLTPSG